MKRELKGLGLLQGVRKDQSFTHHPDEEGTERVYVGQQHFPRFSFTHHPDEEGTESSGAHSSGAPAASFTHHPDEEGTERSSCVAVAAQTQTLHTPSR